MHAITFLVQNVQKILSTNVNKDQLFLHISTQLVLIPQFMVLGQSNVCPILIVVENFVLQRSSELVLMININFNAGALKVVCSSVPPYTFSINQAMLSIMDLAGSNGLMIDKGVKFSSRLYKDNSMIS